MSLSYKIVRLQNRYPASLNTHDPLHWEHGAHVLDTCCCFSKFCFHMKINITMSIPVKCILFLCDWCPWKSTIQRHCWGTKRLLQRPSTGCGIHTLPSLKLSCSSAGSHCKNLPQPSGIWLSRTLLGRLIQKEVAYVFDWVKDLEVKQHFLMGGEKMLRSPQPGPEDRAYEGSEWTTANLRVVVICKGRSPHGNTSLLGLSAGLTSRSSTCYDGWRSLGMEAYQ
jgi:hypothetical protein